VSEGNIRSWPQPGLGFAKVVVNQSSDGNFSEAQLSCSQQACMTGDHDAVWTDQYWIRPAELADTRGHQRYLGVNVGS
jgi:hypothetical protein